MPERFVIWGAGGHGRVIRDVLLACGDEVVGFIDRDHPAGDITLPDGVRLSVVTEDVLDGDRLPFHATALALGVGDNTARLARLGSTVDKFNCPARIHPAVTIGSGVHLGRGSVVMAGTVINAGAIVGGAVIINSRAIIEHDCRVDDGVHLSPGAILCGGVRVGRGAWIGAGATVIPNLTIGAGAVVGAGSTVIADVPDGARVAGSPARPIVSRRTE